MTKTKKSARDEQGPAEAEMAALAREWFDGDLKHAHRALEALPYSCIPYPSDLRHVLQAIAIPPGSAEVPPRLPSPRGWYARVRLTPPSPELMGWVDEFQERFKAAMLARHGGLSIKVPCHLIARLSDTPSDQRSRPGA